MDNSLDLPIEDLGDFLNDQFNTSTDNWQGYSLGYAEEPITTSLGTSSRSTPSISNSRMDLHSAEKMMSSESLMALQAFDSFSPLQMALSPPFLPKDKSMKVEETTLELSTFSIDDKEPSAKSSPQSAPLSSSTSNTSRIVSFKSDLQENSRGAGNLSVKRQRENPPEICVPIQQQADIERGLRKKSREKMRRLEVNVKFEELIELLGLSSKVRKSSILQEAVTTIKALRKERDELRNDRERMQQEISKLATCLQYTHMGSNPMGMMMQAASLPHSHVVQTPSTPTSHIHQQNQVQCTAGTSCFPINPGFQFKSSSRANVSGPIIAPKTDPKSCSETSSTKLAKTQQSTDVSGTPTPVATSLGTLSQGETSFIATSQPSSFLMTNSNPMSMGMNMNMNWNVNSNPMIPTSGALFSNNDGQNRAVVPTSQ